MQLTVTDPKDNQQVDSPLLVSGTATTDRQNVVDQVTVNVDDQEEVPVDPFLSKWIVSFTIKAGVPVTGPGPHKIVVKASDDAGQSVSKTVRFSLAPDQLMYLTVTSPLDLEQVVSPIPVSGLATTRAKGKVQQVTVQLDDNKQPVDVDTFAPDPNVTFTIKAGLPVTGPGPHKIVVTASDDGGQAVAKTVLFSLAEATTGRLTFIEVSDRVQQGFDFATFGVDTSDKVFALWLGQSYGEPTALAHDWITRTAELAMLREALVNKLPVVVTHDPTSSGGTVVNGAPVVNATVVRVEWLGT